VVVYFIFTPEINFFSPVLLFILIGLVASVINIIGDLFESYIKRKAGVKDSGKIIPGHGGILDRIDGTMFTIVFIYIVFLLL
jgi:phosphatidate cytidylyltransferase